MTVYGADSRLNGASIGLRCLSGNSGWTSPPVVAWLLHTSFSGTQFVDAFAASPTVTFQTLDHGIAYSQAAISTIAVVTKALLVSSCPTSSPCPAWFSTKVRRIG